MSKETQINIPDKNQDLENPNPPPSKDPTSVYSADIILFIVNGKRFSIHQSILTTASPVFAAMFNHDSAEREQRTVTIPDVDADVFQAVVQVLYQKQLEHKVLAEMGLEMWIVADKYQMDKLKKLIEQHICPNLTLKTVIPMLLLAHLHNITRIKERCIEYFGENSPKLLKQSTEWSQLLANGSPELFAELYRDVTGAIRQTGPLVDDVEKDLGGRKVKFYAAKVAAQIVALVALIVIAVVGLGLIPLVAIVGVNMTVSWIALFVLFIFLLITMWVIKKRKKFKKLRKFFGFV